MNAEQQGLLPDNSALHARQRLTNHAAQAAAIAWEAEWLSAGEDAYWEQVHREQARADRMARIERWHRKDRRNQAAEAEQRREDLGPKPHRAGQPGFDHRGARLF